MPADTTPLDAAFAALAAFDWGGNAAPLETIDAALVACHGDAALRSDLERRLLAVVAGKTSHAATEYACRGLALIGTTAAVPALASRLSDPDTSHLARFAIERIPGPEPAAALRVALDSVRGDLAIGMISSLASRRDAASVPALVPLLDGDPRVATAAAAALGRIATADAAAALAAAQPPPGPVAEAVIDARLACADAFLAAGDRGAARATYEAVAAAVGAAPTTRRGRAARLAARSGILEALDDTVSAVARRGFIAAWLAIALILPAAAQGGGAEAPPASAGARQAAEAVLEALDAEDAVLGAVALDRIRHGLRGRWFTEEVVARLPDLDASRQADLLLALADRGDAAAVAAATALLQTSRDPDVRIAAVRALGRLGGGNEVAPLVAALTAEGSMPAAARRALVELAGPGAAAAIRTAAGTAATSRPVVIDVLAERRDRAAMPMLIAAAGDGDPTVRQAAMRGLAAFGGGGEIPAMVGSLVKSSGEERKAAELAVVRVCTTGHDAAAATDAMLTAYDAADAPTRAVLLPVLARIGGPRVMTIIDGMLADPARRSQGLDALSKWPDATVKDRLLDLLGGAADRSEKDLLLGTLIRIAPLPDNKLADPQKLELLVKTMALCERDEDRARVLERANAIRTIDTFRFVASYLDDPTVAEAACRSVVELAHHQKLRDAHKDEFVKALDTVLARTTNAELRERATRYKAGRTWDRAAKD